MRRSMLHLKLAVGLVAIAACSDAPTPKPGADAGAGNVAATSRPKTRHLGWWCNEHGVPEEECSMCSARAAKDFKAKGDWCERHDRAKSQCFICDPSLREKYAAIYRAKYGKEPPEPDDNLPDTPAKK